MSYLFPETDVILSLFLFLSQFYFFIIFYFLTLCYWIILFNLGQLVHSSKQKAVNYLAEASDLVEKEVLRIWETLMSREKKEKK